MSFIYLREAQLKSYSATTKGTLSRLRIELEVDNPMHLSFLLGDLAEIEAEQKAAARKAKEEAAAAKRKKSLASPPPRLALPAPPLALPYYGSEDV